MLQGNNWRDIRLQTSKLFRVDLTKIRGKGDFNCPKCGTRISPNDRTEKKYTILETLMKGDELDAVMLQCNRCESQIQLTGFNNLSTNR
jgi:DNA-directed RNA polymerase subunit RPC12/RpoP